MSCTFSALQLQRLAARMSWYVAAQTPSAVRDAAVGFGLDDPSRPCDVVVAYGGEEVQRRSDAKLLPWADLHDVKWIA
jgi:hypothetical protein